MTSSTGFETSIKRALVGAAMLAGMAWTGDTHADDASRTPTAARTAPVRATAPAPGARSFDLHAYGDRFKLAIEGIRKQSRKPDWTWADRDEGGRAAGKD